MNNEFGYKLPTPHWSERLVGLTCSYCNVGRILVSKVYDMKPTIRTVLSSNTKANR